MKIGIVILNWNGLSDTIETLNSLQKITYQDYFVILVDNGSDNNEAGQLEQRFKDYIQVIKLPENLGFAGGCNIGAKTALKQGAEAILLLNNDVVLEPNFLDPLVEKLKESQVGIVSPKIYFEQDRNRVWFAGGGFHWWTGLVFHYGEEKPDAPKYSKTKKVQFITGCSMLIKEEVFDKIGYLDESYKFYWEDADFSLKSRQAGFDLVYVAESRIYHKVSRSLGKKSPERSYLATKNRLVFMRKNFSGIRLAIFVVIFLGYKIPLKVITLTLKGRYGNLKAFFRGVKEGLF